MNRPPSAEVPRDHAARELAHDFNNLLTAIIGATDAALERPGIDQETRSDIAHIRAGAVHGASLVQRFRTGAADAAAMPGLISVSETIRATSRLLAHRLGAKIALKLDLREAGCQVRADPSQLDRMVLNLIANAGQAMRDGGTVTLGTDYRAIVVSEKRVPDTIPSGDYVVITVADTGDGIPDAQIPRIFETGFSSSHDAGGSGLGLSSVLDIVRQAGGFLAVESEPGLGTRFEIYLPRQHDAVPRARERSPLATRGTVLLVEDDLFVRAVAERVLRRAGWTVLCADSSESALTVLRRKSRCDLMISDVAMPGMDGVALARHVQETRPELPIILTSGYERQATEDGFEARDFAFLAKPYGQEDLLGAVARVAEEWGRKS